MARVAVVTGANRGLGLGTARCLAGEGFTVVLTARDLAKAEAAAHRRIALPERIGGAPGRTRPPSPSRRAGPVQPCFSVPSGPIAAAPFR